MHNNNTMAEKEAKIAMLNSYLNVAGKRAQIVEEALKTAKVDVNTGTVELDKSKLANGESITPKPVEFKKFFDSATTSKSQGKMRSPSNDQINLLLGGKLKEAKQIAIPVQTQVQQEYTTHQILNESQDTSGIKRQLREELIRELVSDKDLRLEIMETILYELFSKDRMKKILKEVLNEGREAKK